MWGGPLTLINSSFIGLVVTICDNGLLIWGLIIEVPYGRDQGRAVYLTIVINIMIHDMGANAYSS